MNLIDALTLLLAAAGLIVGIRAYVTSDAQAAKSYAEAAKAVQEDNRELRATIETLKARIKLLESNEQTCVAMLRDWARGIIVLTAQLVGMEVTPRWTPRTDPDGFLHDWPEFREHGDQDND